IHLVIEAPHGTDAVHSIGSDAPPWGVPHPHALGPAISRAPQNLRRPRQHANDQVSIFRICAKAFVEPAIPRHLGPSIGAGATEPRWRIRVVMVRHEAVESDADLTVV